MTIPRDQRQPRELLDIKAAARHLHHSVSYLRRLVARRDIPHYELGHRLLFDVRDLDQFIDRSRRDES